MLTECNAKLSETSRGKKAAVRKDDGVGGQISENGADTLDVFRVLQVIDRVSFYELAVERLVYGIWIGNQRWYATCYENW